MIFDTPMMLQNALSKGDMLARGEFERLCNPVVSSVAELACQRWQLATPVDTLKEQLLRWGAMYLRSIPPNELSNEFSDLENLIGSAASRVLSNMRPLTLQTDLATESDSREFHWKCGPIQLASRSFPLESAAGDRLMADGPDDHQLWVLLADVTGFGLVVRDVAYAITYLWNTSEMDRIRRDKSPKDLLDEFARKLKPIIPFGVFVEAVVLLADSSDEKRRMQIAASGVVRFVKFSRKQRNVQPHRLCGGSLESRSQEWGTKIIRLETGDELLFATDGLFDQKTSKSRLHEQIVNPPIREIRRDGFAKVVQQALEQALQDHPQTDDITWLAVTLPCDCGQGRFKRDCSSLIQSYLSGNRHDFKEIEERFRPRIRGIAKQVIGVDAEHIESSIDDATQEVWTRILNINDETGESTLTRWLHNPERGPFCFWLATVAKNAAIDVISKASKKSQQASLENVDEEVDDESDEADRREEEGMEEIRHCVGQLPLELQRIFFLNIVDGETAADCATILGIPLRTFGDHKKNMLKRLQRCLQRRQEE